jgi:hypothetical protein
MGVGKGSACGALYQIGYRIKGARRKPKKKKGTRGLRGRFGTDWSDGEPCGPNELPQAQGTQTATCCWAFALLFIVGGGLIALIYGGSAAAIGVGCMAAGAVLAGVVILVMLGLQWLSDWLDKRAMGE